MACRRRESARRCERSSNQALGRLLDNAVEFTDQGKIVLGARSLAQGIELWVEDAGIGSEAADLERIFGGFHQVDDENHRRSLGFSDGYSTLRMIQF